MSLGKDLAAEVMKHLSESEVKKLSRAFMSVHEVGREMQKDIAHEFSAMLRASETMVVDGREFAKDVIGSAFGGGAGDRKLKIYYGKQEEPLSTLINDIQPISLITLFSQNILRRLHF